MIEKLDPRLAAMFQGQPQYVQFLAAGIAMILGPTQAAALMDDIQPRDVDWSERVAGHPLFEWNGKTGVQMRAQLVGMGRPNPDKDLDAIRAAYAARNIEFPEGEETATAAPVVTPPGGVPTAPQTVPNAGTMLPPADADTTAGGGANDTLGGNGDTPGVPLMDQKFGGHAYSEIAGKSDNELRAMGNIGNATIQKIRAFEVANNLPGPINPNAGATTTPGGTTVENTTGPDVTRAPATGAAPPQNGPANPGQQ